MLCLKYDRWMALSALVVACLAAQSNASILDYQIDSSQSTLTASANWGWISLQGGNLATSLEGTIKADVTNSSLQIVNSTVTANDCIHGSFNSFWSWLIGMDIGIPNLSFDLSSDPLSLNNGSFGANDIDIAASGKMNYRGSGLLGFLLCRNSTPLTSLSDTNMTLSAGNLVTAGAVERLTIPISLDLSGALADWIPDEWDNVDLTVTGSIVAFRDFTGTIENPKGGGDPNVPEPTTLLMLVLTAIPLLARRR